jgi:NADH-quinone oxidoreductase subunit J
MKAEEMFFFFLAGVALVSALLMITRKSPVISAIFLVLNFLALAGLYLTLQAQFLAIIQVLVYAGAIMVLFVFVIMLLNLSDEQGLTEGFSFKKVVGAILAFTMFFEIMYIVGLNSGGSLALQSPEATRLGTVEHVGTQLFTKFLLPFEITSILLLAAMIGALVLAKKRFE